MYSIDAFSPFGQALSQARAATGRGDASAADRAYALAYGLAVRRASDPALVTDVAVEHVTRLRTLNRSDLALVACKRYLAAPPAARARMLHLVAAETRVALGDLSGLRADLNAAADLDAPPSPRERALQHRLEGLAAGHEGRWSVAEARFEEALAGYRDLDNPAGIAAVEADLHVLDLHRGRDGEIGVAPVAGSPDDTPDRWLARSEALRLHGRYEKALDAIERALRHPVDDARLFFFHQTRVRLLHALHDDEGVTAALPVLRAAAEKTLDPEASRAAAERFAGGRPMPRTPLASDRLAEVRWLAADGKATEAEALLLGIPAPAEPDGRWSAEWHLSAGDVAMAIAEAIAERDRSARLAEQAVAHFTEAVRHAEPDSMIGLRAEAHRRRGDAAMEAGRPDDAADAWTDAHKVEEEIAARQETDAAGVRLLQAVPDEFDERIAAAQRAENKGDRAAAASIGIAVEAAQGAAILSCIMPPGHPPRLRELPAPSDVRGARRWLLRALRGMPAEQVVWMIHTTPDHVHHVLLGRRRRFGRRTIAHTSVRLPQSRVELGRAVDELRACWSDKDRLEMELASGEFDRIMTRVANALRLDALPPFSPHVRRIAIVAGGELSELPFGLLPVPGRDGELLGLMYALSDLPCLAARRPFRLRGRKTRGRSGLLVQPIPGELCPAAPLSKRTALRRETLDGSDATPSKLRARLAEQHPHRVRIDSHAKFHGSATEAVLLLQPDRSPEGHVRPDDLASMDLTGTGTLALAACETGMTTRIGRGERTGFVRAGLLGGCAAVVAARWVVLDDTAARVLDGFEANLAHAPRDIALQHALRAEAARDPGPAAGGYQAARHPARWAAFTLYGDPGYQTDHGPLRRWWQRIRSAPALVGSPG